MKKRLLILSDLWGLETASWLRDYQSQLSKKYNCVSYDSRILAEINPILSSESKIHQQFVHGGIEKAVHQLVLKEKSELVDVLAFSVGATIAWKAILQGLDVGLFYGLSGTRLRYEEVQPTGVIKLFYGSADAFRPKEKWFEKMNLESTVLENRGHNFYMEPEIIKQICLSLLAE